MTDERLSQVGSRSLKMSPRNHRSPIFTTYRPLPMISASAALAKIPVGLRDSLLAEYQNLVQNYMERRWSPAELSGGRFCEVVYCVLDGYGTGAYVQSPTKPSNMVDSCRQLEKRTQVPRSFQILIPRLLPALYEIRNNRGVGHVGGDVDPNHMDATGVLGLVNWIMAELIRVLNDVTVAEAQELVDSIAERRIPLVWESGSMKRVLDPHMPLEDMLLVLISTSPISVDIDSLFEWSGYDNREFVERLLKDFHWKRLVELSGDGLSVQLLPPGAEYVATLLRKHAASRP